MQNMFKGWQKLCFWWLKTLFWSSRLKTHVFENLLNSYSCISFMKSIGLSVFCIKLLLFFKISVFPKFWLIKCIFRPIKNPLIFNHCSQPDLIDVQSMLYRSKLEKFSVSMFFTNFFFHESFIFRIYMHCIFFCSNLVVLQSYFLLFSHITCIHFKLGTQLDLKIDWLIFESFVHFSICYFYVWTVENIFLKRYNG